MAWPNFFCLSCLIAVLYSACISCEPRQFKLSDFKVSSSNEKKSPSAAATLPPFKVKFVIDQATTPKPKRVPNRRRRCCMIGKMAARLGYTCYIRRNIALIRINMPQRQRMKMAIKGDKWGYPFAKEMEYCAKSQKYTRKFNRCCDKETRVMDRETSRK